MKSIAEVLSAIENRAPAASAEDWDNVGLLAGDPKTKTKGAIVSIDLSEAALKKARASGYRLIVTHHPPIFPKSRGLSRIVPGGGVSGFVFRAIEQGVSIITSHTSFDRCALEVVELVSKALGATPRGRLLDGRTRLLKLVAYVPTSSLEKVRTAICEAGAGKIGNYDFCTFGSEGQGTFRGGEGTHPKIGKRGKLERVKETRLETIVPESLSGQVVSALLKAHPYEEVAYDLYPVEQAPTGRGLARGLGYGFYGEFAQAKPFSEVVKNVKQIFQLDSLLVSDPVPRPQQKVRKIAFVAGKGASFIRDACNQGCELFITGEAGYHAALDGATRGMTVMELGHTQSERFFPIVMRGWLTELGLKT